MLEQKSDLSQVYLQGQIGPMGFLSVANVEAVT